MVVWGCTGAFRGRVVGTWDCAVEGEVHQSADRGIGDVDVDVDAEGGVFVRVNQGFLVGWTGMLCSSPVCNYYGFYD